MERSEEAFREEFGSVLLSTYMAGWPSRPSNEDLADHIHLRFEMFADNVVPWVERQAPLVDTSWVEVGSGTGSCTAAFARAGALVHTFEISGPSTAAAKERLRLMDLSHRVTAEDGLFDANCALAKEGRPVDGVILAATLEHMTFKETQEVLKTACKVLRRGGLLVVCDTPNRLCPMDYHTSYTPFFPALPPAVRKKYAPFTARKQFSDEFAEERPKASERLVRWGNGISYHEFELALGPNVHDHIVATGWEGEITRHWPIVFEDGLLLSLFRHYDMRQSVAFARHNLFLILRK